MNFHAQEDLKQLAKSLAKEREKNIAQSQVINKLNRKVLDLHNNMNVMREGRKKVTAAIRNCLTIIQEVDEEIEENTICGVLASTNFSANYIITGLCRTPDQSIIPELSIEEEEQIMFKSQVPEVRLVKLDITPYLNAEQSQINGNCNSVSSQSQILENTESPPQSIDISMSSRSLSDESTKNHHSPISNLIETTRGRYLRSSQRLIPLERSELKFESHMISCTSTPEHLKSSRSSRKSSRNVADNSVNSSCQFVSKRRRPISKSPVESEMGNDCKDNSENENNSRVRPTRSAKPVNLKEPSLNKKLRRQ